MASDGKKFNLFEDTKHESGIIVFSDFRFGFKLGCLR